MSTLEERTANLNAADMAFVTCATVGIVVITPGIALLYGTRKSALTLLMQSYLVTAFVTIQWYFFGFSFSSSPTSSSKMIGNWDLAALHDIGVKPLLEGGSIPVILNWVFTAFFPVCAVAIFLGGLVDRGSLGSSIVLGVLWTTLVYCPESYWAWSANGWLNELGDLDFAGGGPVHVSSGVAALAYSLYLGKRKTWKDSGKKPAPEPLHPVLNFLGSLLIYFPWLFFNSATMTTITTVRTIYILANTHIAASFGLATFVCVDYYLNGQKKWSLVAAAEGLICGLVFVTPACGYLEPWAIVIGSIFTAGVCRLTYNISDWLGVDEPIHSFNIHGIGGIIGAILVGVFASPTVAGYDGATEIEGGWIFHHWKQMGYQLAGTVSMVAWTFVMTYILCFIIDYIPGLQIRIPEEAEEEGLDKYTMLEAGYASSSIFALESFAEKTEVLDAQNVGSSVTSVNANVGDNKGQIEQV